jgi:two-component system, NtrC family, sensor histidine kinase HydH
MPQTFAEDSSRSISRWNVAAYCCVTVALGLVLAITAWGAYVDFSVVRATLLESELNRCRSHAVRTVARIQDRLGTPGSSLVSALEADNWLHEYWDKWIPADESRLYAAIVDSSAKILMHSNRKLEGGQLGPGWYDRVLEELDTGEPGDTVETRHPPLTGGGRAFDIRVPIIQRGKEVADYHTGLDYDWFQRVLAEKNVATRTRWIGIFVVSLLVIGVTGISLYKIVRRTLLLREAIQVARVRQFAELGELAAGIAHEIRNPINAIRLNLFALQRLQQFAPTESGEQSADVIAEATREIERVEGLMRIMLGYARPAQPNEEDIDVRAELEAMISLIKPVIDRDKVCIRCRLSPTPLYVHLDRSRFRQIMLNLLNNAKEAVGPEGEIDVSLARRGREAVEITVSDSGRGVWPTDLDRIFDPLYSSKELGAGLGLALVKRFVEEAHGSVACEAHSPEGTRFRLTFQRAVAESTLVADASQQ